MVTNRFYLFLPLFGNLNQLDICYKPVTIPSVCNVSSTEQQVLWQAIFLEVILHLCWILSVILGGHTFISHTPFGAVCHYESMACNYKIDLAHVRMELRTKRSRELRVLSKDWITYKKMMMLEGYVYCKTDIMIVRKGRDIGGRCIDSRKSKSNVLKDWLIKDKCIGSWVACTLHFIS